MFGGGTTTPFGSPPGGGGATGGFGQPPTTTPTFGGGGTGFGAPAPSPGPFGAAPAGGGFGGMGAPSTTGGFGTGGSTFGSATPGATGGFGTTPTTSTFGAAPSSSPFGAPAPAPSAFGGTTTTPGFGGAASPGTFGAPSTTSAFGTSGGFGTTTTTPTASTFGGGGFGTSTTNTFGTPAPASAFGTGGGFGAPSPAPATTGLFGAPAPAPGGGGIFGGAPTTPAPGAFGSAPAGTSVFGGSPALAAPAGQAPAWAAGQQQISTGTRQHPYVVTPRSDGNSATINLQTITAMPPYMNFSIEELRLQDYAEGTRGTAGASPGVTGGMFGGAPAAPGGFGSPAPAPAGGLFGSAPAPSAFGAAPAASTGGFGAFGSTTPAPAPFGAAPSAFGAAPPATPGFGAAPATGAFGSTPTAPGGAFGISPVPAKPPASTGLFGGGGGAFGAPAAPSPGLFGAAPAPPAATGFGQPAPAPAGGGLFGGGSGFGATPAPAPGTTGAFGQPSPSPGGGLFGSGGGFGTTPSPAPAFGGGFGAAPAPSAFGAAPSSGLFGGTQPAPAAPSLFGGATSTSLFGAAQPGQAGAFGQPTAGQAPTLGGTTAFAAQPAVPAAPMIHPTGNIMPPATNELVAAQLAAMEAKRKEMEKSDNFQNQPLASSTVTAATQSESSALRNLAAVRPSYPVYHSLSPSNAKIRPRGFASPPDNAVTSQSLSNLGIGGRPMAAPGTVAATASTRLTIRPKSKPSLKLALGSAEKKDENTDDPKTGGGNKESVAPLTNGRSVLKSLRSPAPATHGPTQTDRPEPVSTPQPPSSAKQIITRTPGSASTTGSAAKSLPAIRNAGFEHYQRAAGMETVAAAASTSEGPMISSAAPKLSKPGYSCSPSISELQKMPPEDLAAVPDFFVEVAGVGKIEWEGAVDVRNADLDTIILIEKGKIEVYHKEEFNDSKPPMGTKLNRPAILTMYGIFPREGQDPKEFGELIETRTREIHATLQKSYDVTDGEWVFKVAHFSRYSLYDDDNDNNADAVAREPLRASNQKKVLFKNDPLQEKVSQRSSLTIRGGKERRQDTPFKPSAKTGISVATPQAPSADGMDVGFETDEDAIIDAAENAFTQMEIVASTKKAEDKLKKDTEDFTDEGSTVNASSSFSSTSPSSTGTCRFRVSTEDMVTASNTKLMTSISNRLAKSVSGSKTSGSRTDFGFSMGRSFRVGWGPDGSFISCNKDGVISRSKPIFSSKGGVNDAMFETQMQKSRKLTTTKSGCPLFVMQARKISGQNADTLEQTLQQLAESSDDAESRDAFKLLKVLKQKPQSSFQDSEVQRRFITAVTEWLVDSVAEEVENEVSALRSNHDQAGMILAALSGGNKSKAGYVAGQAGYSEMAVLLSSSCPQGKADLKQELDEWSKSGVNSQIPPKLLRAYHMIAGNQRFEDVRFQQNEENPAFDWRRRMLINLVYSSSHGKDLPAVLQDYEVKITSQTAPFPTPRYMGRGSSEKTQSVAYQLLQFGAESPSLNFASIFDPSGYSSNPDDFGLGFCLAACMTAISHDSSVGRLTAKESRSLLDGVVANLVSAGRWEMAVWASLFALCDSPSLAKAQEQQAKKLVLKYFRGDVKSRDFLETLGIPQSWLSEADAYQSATNGDFFAYLTSIAKTDLKKARLSLEERVVPNILFMNDDEIPQWLSTLETITGPDGSLSKAVLTLFDINNTINSLEGYDIQTGQLNEELSALREGCDSIEYTLKKHKSHLDSLKEHRNKQFSGTYTVEMKYFLSEAARHVALFRLKMTALENGRSIHSSLSELLLLQDNVKEADGTNAMEVDSSSALRAYL